MIGEIDNGLGLTLGALNQTAALARISTASRDASANAAHQRRSMPAQCSRIDGLGLPNGIALASPQSGKTGSLGAPQVGDSVSRRRQRVQAAIARLGLGA